MADQDIPYVDEDVVELPSDMRADIAEKLRNDHFGFSLLCGNADITRQCHGPVSVVLKSNPHQFKILLLPRDHLKTSHITIAGGLWMATRNPEARIAVFNAVAKKATNMLLAIRTIVDSNKVYRALFSSIIPKDLRRVRWNQEGLDFLREGTYQDPTISAYGIEGTATSSHFTHQIWDDPIEEDAYRSPDVMKDVITRMSGIQALMDNHTKDTVWLVGTHWALHDVYTHYRKVWGKRCAMMVRSVIEDGKIIFPEKMGTMEDLTFLQSTMTPYRWSCWYMNRPRDEQLQTFNVKDLKYWSFSSDEQSVIMYDREGLVHRVVGVDKLDITVTVDLASAEKASDDRNAITTTGVTPWGEIIVLDAWARRCTPLEVIDYLFVLKNRFHPRVFGIEDVAYQKAFKWFLKAQASQQGLWFNIVPIKAIGRKETRIEGLQPLAATGRLWLKSDQLLLLQEAADFPLGEHDDLIDSLSMHLQLWRGIMDPSRWAKLQAAEKMVVSKMLGLGSGPALDNFERDFARTLPPGWGPAGKSLSSIGLN